MRPLLTAVSLALSAGTYAHPTPESTPVWLLIIKARHRVFVMKGGRIAKSYPCVFGGNPVVDKAYEGVAMGLAMESPSLPAGTNFGVSGGVGYYNDKTAATAAFAARVGDNASISAGVGVGLNSGEVGARGGFQFAW